MDWVGLDHISAKKSDPIYHDRCDVTLCRARQCELATIENQFSLKLSTGTD